MNYKQMTNIPLLTYIPDVPLRSNYTKVFCKALIRTAEFGQQSACDDTPIDQVATIISTVARTNWQMGI